MNTYSFTAFNDWLCPYRGKLKRIDKHKEAESDILLVGRHCADIMKDYRHICLDHGNSSDFEYLDNASGAVA